MNWIEIKTKYDLPKQKGYYHWFNKKTELITLQHINPKWESNTHHLRFSHYQLITKPERPVKKMKLIEAISVLEHHNLWRRGADTEMTNPKKLGEAIEIATDLLKQLLNPL